MEYFARAFSQKNTQKTLFTTCSLILLTLMMALAIAGSLSRSTWISTSIGLVLMACAFSYYFPNKPQELESDDFSRKSRKKPVGYYLARLKTPLLLLLSCTILLFFLNERGKELVGARIDFAVKNSIDDIRWTMYGDTWRMIGDSPVAGVGLSNWAERYQRYMDQDLSGINPVYLHSEPLQALSELGILGISPLLCLVFLLLNSAFGVIKNLREKEKLRLRVLGLSIGALTVCLASFFDFPFRIPALVGMLAIYIGLLCTSIEAD
jgi:O-antigen ligase